MLLLAWAVLPASAALAAQVLEAPQTVPEGEAFVVRLVSDEPLVSARFRFLGRELRPVVQRTERGMEAWALLGVGMHERTPQDEFELTAVAVLQDGERTLSQTIFRTPKQYAEQHLDVARKYVHLSDEELARHRGEQALVREAFARTTVARSFSLPLEKPLQGRTSSTFGLRRFFNGEARNPHSGWDIAAPEGTQVHACADGEVVLAGNHYFAGNSVYIDHGQGVVSVYMHLSKISVREGARVRRGEVVGLVGATGRVTGPHLHWGVAVLGQMVDPSLLVRAR
jgi:murein DD-endopeptidase MepM/ murein hydrolase activator NlpD